jgi:hypothetical protein
MWQHDAVSDIAAASAATWCRCCATRQVYGCHWPGQGRSDVTAWKVKDGV